MIVVGLQKNQTHEESATIVMLLDVHHASLDHLTTATSVKMRPILSVDINATALKVKYLMRIKSATPVTC